MNERKRGRVAADGAEIVACQTARLTLDQVSLEVIEEFTEKTGGNISAALRALCHAYRDLKNAGGHCISITDPAAGAAAEKSGGHAKRNTARGAGAGGAGEAKIGAVAAAAQEARERKWGGLLSEYTKDGGRKAAWKVQQDRDAYARGQRTPS